MGCEKHAVTFKEAFYVDSSIEASLFVHDNAVPEHKGVVTVSFRSMNSSVGFSFHTTGAAVIELLDGWATAMGCALYNPKDDKDSEV